jgi:DNA-binding NtrC family response regulator
MRSPDGVQARVLIVDDQLDLLRGLQAILEFNGIEVILHDSVAVDPSRGRSRRGPA